MDIKEQKEMLILNIKEDEEYITNLKERIRLNKSKLKKILKLEKEMLDIFGMEDTSENNEIPGQISMDEYEG